MPRAQLLALAVLALLPCTTTAFFSCSDHTECGACNQDRWCFWCSDALVGDSGCHNYFEGFGCPLGVDLKCKAQPSPSPAASPSATPSASPSPSPSITPTPSRPVQARQCADYYWTRCSASHPGCEGGFEAVDVGSRWPETNRDGSLTDDWLCWWTKRHWKCCKNYIADDTATIGDWDWVFGADTAPQRKTTAATLLCAGVAVWAVVAALGVVWLRRRATPLAHQDAAALQGNALA